MGSKQAYELQTRGEDLANAVLLGDLNQKSSTKAGKFLPRFYIKTLEHLIQAGDVKDNVEQATV